VLSQKALLLGASRRPELRRLVTGTPATRRVVDRFVAGETLDEALGVVRSLTGEGIAVTLDHLGEGVTDRAEACAPATPTWSCSTGWRRCTWAARPRSR
jgi:proline dehydrogenase